ncbi:MAG TPA: hypothetical protein VHG91_15010 [Longimicrobium sp.]|nr:hypothetical protein [Longimicrobium sp.]
MRYDRGDYFRGTWGGARRPDHDEYGSDYRVHRGGGYGGYGDDYVNRGGYAGEHGYVRSTYDRDYLGRPLPGGDRQIYTGRERPGYGRGGGYGADHGVRGYDRAYGGGYGGGPAWRGHARYGADYGDDYGPRDRPRGVMRWVRQAFTGRPPRAY